MLVYKLVYNVKELNTASKDGYGYIDALDLNTWLVAKDEEFITQEAPVEEVKEEEVEEPQEEVEVPVEVPQDTTEAPTEDAESVKPEETPLDKENTTEVPVEEPKE